MRDEFRAACTGPAFLKRSQTGETVAGKRGKMHGGSTAWMPPIREAPKKERRSSAAIGTVPTVTAF